ncbi:uncharacterized protein L201_003040 [Kwoniella dendrophila CBS 6074]|uniref:AMP-activated protein kinase glycogen-binding domain-containing protein n=1 Tax=Kwoniella dendrophila CBS 6074 TaxID=1295534 RepID=A0AAX4JRW1_9TREE
MSSTDKHHATFSWGAGAQTVNIAGNFNNWSADATPLEKQADGSFTAQVPLPWGEKQAFKYVVDGEWKVREDEAKEWDAAGNMNNVYTAPPPPVSTSHEPAHHQSHAPSAAAVSQAAPTPAPASTEKTAKPTEEDKPSERSTGFSSSAASAGPVPAAVPAKNVKDTPAPTSSTSAKTEPETLIASSAPGAASSSPKSSSGLAAFNLGSPAFPTSQKPKSTSTNETVIAPATTSTTTTTAPSATTSAPAVTVPAEPVVPASTTDAQIPAPAAAKANATPLAEEPIAVQIEKVAKQANIGEAPQPGTEEHGIAEKASDFAAGALAAIGAVVGNAAVAVENFTGVDLGHAPISVEEAKAQGIDIKTLDKVDAPTDTVAPVGTAPPASAVDALQEKVDALKVGTSASTSTDTTGISAVPLPKTAEPKTSLPPPGTVNLNQPEPEKKPEHDIPAQHETVENHQSVPQPIITTISDKDPKKDRTAASTSIDDTAGTKPIGANPGVSAKAEKEIAERDPARTAAASDSPLSEPKVAPDAPATNTSKGKDQSKNVDKLTPEPQAKSASSSIPQSTSSSTPQSASTVPASASATQTHATPAASAAPATATVPPVHPSPVAPSTPAKVAPATPAKDVTATPASISSTPASTPAKSTHTKEQTTDSDIRKRKSSFFHKVKHAFSSKDKSK